MGMSDYQDGYQAYFAERRYDPARSQEWRSGWLDAEDDDLHSDGYDYYDDFGDY